MFTFSNIRFGSRIISLIFAFLFIGCKYQKKTSTQLINSQKEILIKTWDILDESPAKQIFQPQIEELPPETSFIWGGTVSHHLLADVQIDNWFHEISKRRNVKTFFIICPSHYSLSTQTWSLANCTWQTKKSFVKTNINTEKKIAKKLEVPFDPQVFPYEHGINTLIPYIAKYFPGAKICTIAVHGEPPLNQKEAQKLTDSLQPYFSEKGKTENFLLISTDFAHHGDLSKTNFKDTHSRKFFLAPSQDSWIFCGCDNRPGIYVLAKFLTPSSKSAIMYHTNSYELSGQDEFDITSYFFTFFYSLDF